MSFDVVVVGAGPAGLSAAIRLKQLAKAQNKELSVCVVEKGAEVGAHILSGACIDPITLNELLPDWKEREAPLRQPVTDDQMYYLTSRYAIPVPLLRELHNKGNYLISLGELCRWLAGRAEELGVEIYPGFAASEVLYENAHDPTKTFVTGVATGDLGIAKDGSHKANYTPGVELLAKQTIFSEGCRGSLTKMLMRRFRLREGYNLAGLEIQPQTYGLGLKELWELDPKRHQPGLVVHTLGWPVDDLKTWAGSFMYHVDGGRLAMGYVVALDYENPYMSPYQEFQRFKHHTLVRNSIEGGRCIAYGARTLSEGGIQSMPKLTFPGGLLIGDCAGFLNVPRIKGTHTAMKSATLAAEAVFDKFAVSDAPGQEVKSYSDRIRDSWLFKELWSVRNHRPSFSRFGAILGSSYMFLDSWFMRGFEPWTLRHHFHPSPEEVSEDKKLGDHSALRSIKDPSVKPIHYPKPDGRLSFDLLTNLSRSGTNHEHDQPSHLKLIDPSIPKQINKPKYDGPESRYCPAGVYEYPPQEGSDSVPDLHINAQNCLHCKACDIKDPTQNINWTVPQGGDGPAYAASM